MRKLFGIHIWKDGPRRLKYWQRKYGYSILIARDETPEEYHKRKNNMVTLLIFGKLLTFKIPFRK